MVTKKVRLFGIEIDNMTIGEAVEWIANEYAAVRKRAMVTTPNVDVVVQLDKDPQLREDYARASLILADGAPIIFASRLLGTPLVERVAGSDIFPLLCERARDLSLKVLLLGGSEGVAQKAAENLAGKFPGLQISAYTPSFGFDTKPEECRRIVSMINEYQPHLLFLGVGTPRQERWIAKYQGQYCPCVSIGVGGSLDFEAGRIRRAPEFLRNLGLEWLYRLAREPKRLYRRYLIEDRRFFRILFGEVKRRKFIRTPRSQS
jgi:N-acetylglucosaminyldiphosphoundecaprenol N-acetyl-beta-D-mannosaminyltransferase